MVKKTTKRSRSKIKTKKNKKTKRNFSRSLDKLEMADYLKIAPEKRKKLIDKFSKLSPFEFKNILIKRSEKGSGKIYNVGRGNPNFFNSFCRVVFANFQKLAVSVCKSTVIPDLKNYPTLNDHNYEQVILKGSTGWPQKQREYIKDYINYLKKHSGSIGISNNAILHDSVQSALGCFYPTPPRCQNHLRLIVQEYMYNLVMKTADSKAANNKTLPGLKMKPSDFDFFITEGAAAGIMYVLNTLSKNYLVNPGDKIAIITPIFSPYLEMPDLAEYSEKIVRLKGDPENNYSLSDSEINKLKNKQIKALFMVNPANPASYSLSRDNINKIGNIVNNERQDLIVLADNVYAPFAQEYNSFMLTCPKNTIEVFSLSKYFGTTGWRLGVVMTAKDNRINRLFNKLPAKKRKILKERYEIVTMNPEGLTIMDRIVSDSREVAQEHVSGLSTPQQVLLGMLLFYDLNDKERVYEKAVKKILLQRITDLYKPLNTDPGLAPTATNYYHLMYIPRITENLFGLEARENLEKNYSGDEFLLHLSLKYKVVLMQGKGFGASDWRLRISLANMATENYKIVGEKIRDAIKDMISRS